MSAHTGRHVVVSTRDGLRQVARLPHADRGGDLRRGPTRGVVDPGGGPGWRQRPHTALYLAPTKALAHDQMRTCTELGLDRWRIAAVDGDTSGEDRDWARDYATFVFSNPDLLHRSVLPAHTRWRGLLQSLRYVVLDEAHRYRGVFGAQVAAVLRRLRRLAAHYGARPTFVLASATVTDAAASAAALLGVAPDDVDVVDRDSSARGSIEVTLRQPDGSAEDETADLLARTRGGGPADHCLCSLPAAVRAGGAPGARTSSRCSDPPGSDARVIEAYRGGYLASDRRRLEADLQSGRLRGDRRDQRAGARRGHRGPGRGGDLRLPRKSSGLVAAGRTGGSARPQRTGDPGGPPAATGRLPLGAPRNPVRRTGRGHRPPSGQSVRARATAGRRRAGASDHRRRPGVLR